MRRPLLIPLIVHVAGVLLEWWLRFGVDLLWCVAAPIAGVCLLCPRGRPVGLLALVGVLGALSTALRVELVSPADLRLAVGPLPRLATLHGRLAKDPVLRRGTRETEVEPQWRVELDCSMIEDREGRREARGRVMVFARGRMHHRMRTGTEVSVSGVLSPPPAEEAQGLFSYREKLRREGIHYQLRTQLRSDWKRIETLPKPGLDEQFRGWAVRRLRGGGKEDDSTRLLAAMILGLRTGLTDEVAEPFMRSGTMHIFAISGLHVAMVAGILVLLLRVVRIPRSVCGAILVPSLWFYCHVTGWQSSATRATIMMSVIVMGWALKRPADLLNSVCAAAWIILLWDPLQLMQASFQLSFAVVMTIALIWPRLDERGGRWFASDPFLPNDLEPPWKRRLRRSGRWCYSLVAVSLAAWLGSMPLIAHYFHLWTPGSLLANPPVVLMTMGAIGSALGALLTAWAWPFGGEVFSHGAWFWVHCQSRVSGWVAGLSGGWFHVPAPGLPEIAFYYALLFGWSVGWFNRRRLAAACLAAGLLLCVRLERSRGGEITVLGGESNAIWCDLPGSRDDLLIDCGRKEGVERVLIPYLELRGVRRLPRLLLTHGDAAHVEGFSLVHDRFEPEQVMMGPVEQRSPVYRAIRAGVSGPVWVRRGDSIGAWRVLHPTDGTGVATADDVAVTLIGEWDGVRVLVMPDASRRAQREMLESRAGLKANVLILGCPRDGETVLDEFLKRVEPEVVVVQDNRIPAYDRVGGELLRRLRALTGRVYTVSREGSVTVRLRVGGLEVSVVTR